MVNSVWWFQVNSKVIQWYTHTHLFFLNFFSIMMAKDYQQWCQESEDPKQELPQKRVSGHVLTVVLDNSISIFNRQYIKQRGRRGREKKRARAVFRAQEEALRVQRMGWRDKDNEGQRRAAFLQIAQLHSSLRSNWQAVIRNGTPLLRRTRSALWHKHAEKEAAAVSANGTDAQQTESSNGFPQENATEHSETQGRVPLRHHSSFRWQCVLENEGGKHPRPLTVPAHVVLC